MNRDAVEVCLELQIRDLLPNISTVTDQAICEDNACSPFFAPVLTIEIEAREARRWVLDMSHLGLLTCVLRHPSKKHISN